MKKIIPLLMLFLAACLSAAPDNYDPYKNARLDLNYTNGLNIAERNVYYYADEGVQYLPYDVLASMSRPKSDGIGIYDQLFLERPERLGLIPNLYNRDFPPIGITVSQNPEYVPMAGINCATCHTNVIFNSKHQAVLIDGSTSYFAIDRLIKEMIFATIYTLINPAEFNRFYDRYQERSQAGEYPFSKNEFNLVIGTPAFSKLTKSLESKQNFSEEIEKFDQEVLNYKLNSVKKTSLISGAYPTQDQLSSRAGMFSYLLKRLKFFYQQTTYAQSDPTVAASNLGRSNPWGSQKNMYASLFFNKESKDWPKVTGGPISTPSIWTYDDYEGIFATGVINSVMDRNFAQGVALVTDFNANTLETTVSIKKLHQVVGFTKKITPPAWPEKLLGKIDQDQAEAGKQIFKRECLNCHNPKRELYSGPGTIPYNYYNVGTDPEYYKAQVEDFYGKELFSEVLTPLIAAIKNQAAKNEGITDLIPYQGGRNQIRWRQPQDNEIEARPLWGIWATAPYLHNGSVLNLRELLTPPAQRLSEFWQGNLEYDVENMGFKNEPLYFSDLLQVNCAKCKGNSNLGHNFGTMLPLKEKNQLLEFLKIYSQNTKF